MSERRLWLVLAAVAVAAIALVVALTPRPGGNGPLDPASTDRGGARAVARVLAAHGVQVDVRRSARALAAARVDAETTVVVVQTDNLAPTTARQLLDKVYGAHLVAVEPGPEASRLLEVGADPVPVPRSRRTRAGCSGMGMPDLEVAVDSATTYDAPGCFASKGGHLLVSQGVVTVWGAGEALTNDQILRADNAAVVLRLLGQRPHLVWYVPSLADVPAHEGVTLAHLLPRWLGPAGWLTLLAVVAVVLWRGRRLGPLATEPLPVVVRASETTEALGRLYRRSGDRAHAAEILRDATTHRLAAVLRLGSVTPEALAEAAAARAGRPSADVAELLAGPAPQTDAALVELAHRLAALEEEVRRP